MAADGRVEGGVAGEASYAITMDTKEVELSDGAVSEATEKDDARDTNGGDDLGERLAEADGGEGEVDADGGQEGDEGGEDAEALADFDPDNEEVIAAYDARYSKDDGTFNEEALSKEFWANQEAGNEGLNEGTYAWLAKRGISKDFARQVEAALVTQHQAAGNKVAKDDMALFDLAGGPENLKAALDWGKTGGYDKAAQDRFNKVMAGKDIEAKKEAVELLLSRHGKVKASQDAKAEAVARKTPRRDATAQSAPAARTTVQPFKDKAAWREAKKAAGDNHEALREVARRRAVSRFTD